MRVIATIETDGQHGYRIMSVTAETTIGVVMTWLKMLEDDGYKVKSCQFCRSRNGFETPGLVPDTDKVSILFIPTPDEVTLCDADGSLHKYKFDDAAWTNITLKERELSEQLIKVENRHEAEKDEGWWSFIKNLVFSEIVFDDSDFIDPSKENNNEKIPNPVAAGWDEIDYIDNNGKKHRYKFINGEWVLQMHQKLF